MGWIWAIIGLWLIFTGGPKEALYAVVILAAIHVTAEKVITEIRKRNP